MCVVRTTKIAPGLPKCYDLESSTFLHSTPIGSMISEAALAFGIAEVFYHRICMHLLSKSMENNASSAFMADQQAGETLYEVAATHIRFL